MEKATTAAKDQENSSLENPETQSIDIEKVVDNIAKSIDELEEETEKLNQPTSFPIEDEKKPQEEEEKRRPREIDPEAEVKKSTFLLISFKI